MFWRRIFWRWPALVWIGLAALAVWLYDHGGEYIRINGMIEVISESVAPLESGYLKKVHVKPGEDVSAGQIVAEMDTVFIDEEIAQVEESLRNQQAEDIRQFVSASQRLQEELREWQLQQVEDQSELSVYQSELKRLEELVESGYATSDELTDYKARVVVLEDRLELYPEFMEKLKIELLELDVLRETAVSMNEPGQIDLMGSSRLELLRQRRDTHFLRATQDGTVTRVRRQLGEVIETGEQVVQRKPSRILAFMDEADTRPITVGDIVEVEPGVGGERIQAKVISISPNVLALPDRASPIPDRVVRGRRLELEPMESLDLAPGASVVVILPREQMLWTSLLGGWGL
jgi:multidrug resistance efflux pump